MGNEALTREFQAAQGQRSTSERVTAVDVDRGVKQSLDTGISNQYAMTFEATDESGKKTVSAYVKKAGRSLKLNEAAMVKGGLALLRSICVRSSWEKPEQIKAMYDMLPDDLKRKFIESRGDDFRVFTSPADRAIYLFIVLFKSGEKWMGEGIAYPGNVKSSKLHVRLDELAETRAFNRCVGRGLADGFINQDQVAGSELGDDDGDIEDDEDEVRETRNHTPMALPIPRQQEADPAGSDPFRTSESAGTGGTGADSGDGAGAQASPATEEGASPAGAGEPLPPSGQPGHQQDGGNSGADAQPHTSTVDSAKLIALASQKGVHGLHVATKKFDREVKSYRDLTDFEKSILWDDISALPDKTAASR